MGSSVLDYEVSAVGLRVLLPRFAAAVAVVACCCCFCRCNAVGAAGGGAASAAAAIADDDAACDQCLHVVESQAAQDLLMPSFCCCSE